MFVAELWRYPVKSLKGMPLDEATVTPLGIEGDREIVIVGEGRIRTARRFPKLLGLRGGVDQNGRATIDGLAWDSAEAKALVSEAVGAEIELVQVEGPERFDVLPLLVATDGAIAAMGVDRRRFRPNILIGGVEGLAERTWEGRRLQLGEAVIEAAQLRARCVMTTFDPDTQAQDPTVLKRIVNEFEGTMALDCSVIKAGRIRINDRVTLL